MARKSRKPAKQAPYERRNSDVTKAAAYVRLSADDHKSDSIKTQQSIILNYIANNPHIELYDTYIDSGISGTSFERPGFKQMLLDAENGKINCIIVKDLSRLGREMIEMGYYAEKVFPRLGIRLISIGDDYDSETYQGGIRLPFINIMNEAYAFDISRKTKSQVQQYIRDGIYVGGKPPYGYMKPQGDRQSFVIDKVGADIVRQIFMWAAGGVSMSEITRKLNTSSIPSPGRNKAKAGAINTGTWHISTVTRILSNEVYLGNMVQGKTKAIRSGRQKISPDEYVNIPSAHEAIITPELFYAAQTCKRKLNNKADKRLPAQYTKSNIYRGKIFCAYCGRYLERTKSNNKHIFRCVSNRTMPGSCVGNRISEEMINATLIEQISRLSDIFLPEGESMQMEITVDLLPELRYIDMRLATAGKYLRSLYENLADGYLEQAEYIALREQYTEEIENLKRRAYDIEKALNIEDMHKKQYQEMLRLLHDFAKSQAKMQEIVDLLVDRLEIYPDGRVHVILHSSMLQ